MSRILSEIHESVSGLYKIGLVTDEERRIFEKVLGMII